MIGRERELKDLNRLYNSGRAELVAIYGRRRVGKTFLVDETFAGRTTFRHAGLSPADEEAKGLMQAQLNHSAWSKKSGDEEGIQIDLLIERKDNVINMCEIKFTSEAFAVDKNTML